MADAARPPYKGVVVVHVLQKKRDRVVGRKGRHALALEELGVFEDLFPVPRRVHAYKRLGRHAGPERRDAPVKEVKDNGPFHKNIHQDRQGHLSHG